MKLVIQKETGLGETCVAELDNLTDYWAAHKAFDERLWATNQKIVEVRDFVSQIKDPNYRYLFVNFFDTLMGISSQAEPLQRKLKLDPPEKFDEWLAKKDRALETVKK